MMRLSILICSIKTRFDLLKELLDKLDHQIQLSQSVEVLYLGDNRMMTVGEKRNNLLSIAKGERVAFIDDDDLIAPGYIEAILNAPDADVVTFNADNNGQIYKYSTTHTSIKKRIRAETEEYYALQAGHLNAWKKGLCVQFENKSYSEDHRWAAKMNLQKRTEHRIDEVLYFYRHNINGDSITR